MKQQACAILAAIVSLTCISGCVKQEKLKIYEIAEVSNNGTENRYVEEYVDQDGKKVVNKQIRRESQQCLDKNGRPLPSKTAADCMKRKGKLVGEVYQEEKITRTR